MIVRGDCLHRLKEFPDNSVDSIVTDPPYGLRFMGKKWDYDVPSVDCWREVFRVLKPGGHLLSFGGTRTYHRMVVAIEDAGFEVRDQIQWLYGSGFPKSHNIEKAIEDKRFEGWGTALKPANEPIVLARKPLSDKTVAENVLKWGTGGLNIDEGRIPSENNEHFRSFVKKPENSQRQTYDGARPNNDFEPTNSLQGRFPANVLLDEVAAEMLDEQSGHLHGAGNKKDVDGGFDNGMFGNGIKRPKRIDGFVDMKGGGASRFFYVAKASKRERGEGNVHPTVKPIKLMEYLINLITPPGGIVLDPFMGSGSTGVAAKRLGFKFIGIELNDEYAEIAEKRIESASAKASLKA